MYINVALTISPQLFFHGQVLTHTCKNERKVKKKLNKILRGEQKLV